MHVPPLLFSPAGVSLLPSLPFRQRVLLPPWQLCLSIRVERQLKEKGVDNYFCSLMLLSIFQPRHFPSPRFQTESYSRSGCMPAGQVCLFRSGLVGAVMKLPCCEGATCTLLGAKFVCVDDRSEMLKHFFLQFDAISSFLHSEDAASDNAN